jgi:AcrR family transcriptional regulator
MPTDTGGREAILDTSAKLFSQQGYNGVSIRDIAQACGMTNAALYYHFKNKEDLFLAMLQRDHEKAMASLREAANSPGDLREDLRQLVMRYAEITCARRQSFQTLWRDLRSIEDVRGHKMLGEMRFKFLGPLEERIAQAQVDGEIKPGEARLYARLLHGLILALTNEGPPGKQHKPTSQEVELVVDVFLNGTRERIEPR